MLKQLSLAIISVALITGCGGSSNNSGPRSSSSIAASSSSQATNSVASSEAPSSVSSSSSSSSTPSEPSADLSFGFEEGIEGWFINGSENEATVSTEMELTHDQINSALSIKPLNWISDNWRRQARIALPGNPTLNNSTIELVINIPQTYIDDNTLTLQIVVDGPTADYGTYITMAELQAGDNTITIQRSVVDATHLGIQLTTPPTLTSLLDAVLVKSIFIELPDGSSSSSQSSSSSSSSGSDPLRVDFESDSTGQAYGGTGWANPPDLSATVVSIASVTAGSGLPGNGDSINVLKVAPTDYNTIPVFEVTLPEGKTLADYSVTVDAYFPHNSLGLSGGQNAYKEFFFLAGTVISGGANNTNAAYHTKLDTGGSQDAWNTFSFTVDPTKGASLTGSIQIGLGISRPANNTHDDAYYLDNITLVEIE